MIHTILPCCCVVSYPGTSSLVLVSSPGWFAPGIDLHAAAAFPGLVSSRHQNLSNNIYDYGFIIITGNLIGDFGHIDDIIEADRYVPDDWIGCILFLGDIGWPELRDRINEYPGNPLRLTDEGGPGFNVLKTENPDIPPDILSLAPNLINTSGVGHVEGGHTLYYQSGAPDVHACQTKIENNILWAIMADQNFTNIPLAPQNLNHIRLYGFLRMFYDSALRLRT